MVSNMSKLKTEWEAGVLGGRGKVCVCVREREGERDPTVQEERKGRWGEGGAGTCRTHNAIVGGSRLSGPHSGGPLEIARHAEKQRNGSPLPTGNLGADVTLIFNRTSAASRLNPTIIIE
uniref:Uncharacterized protein n=1 Tax=Arundo donax TaxID=35708 RepID=A0A0A9A7C8_ARUDO